MEEDKAAAVTVTSAATVTPTADADAGAESIIPEETSSTFRNVILGLLFIGVIGALMAWLRTFQWVRRFVSGKERGVYRRVDNDDVEK